MAESHRKVQPVSDAVGDRLGQIRRNLHHATAVLAHEMSVAGLGEVVNRGAMSEVDVDHDPDLLEALEDPVHGARGYVGTRRLDE